MQAQLLAVFTYNSVGTGPLLEELKHASNEETSKVTTLEDFRDFSRFAFTFEFNSTFNFFHFLGNKWIVFRDITKSSEGLATLLSLAVRGKPTKGLGHERNTEDQNTARDDLNAQRDLPLSAVWL